METQTSAAAAATTKGDPFHILFVGVDTRWFGQIKRDIGLVHPSWTCSLGADLREGPKKSDWETATAVVIDGVAAGAKDWFEAVRKERADLTFLVRADFGEKNEGGDWKGTGLPVLPTTSDSGTLVSTLLRNIRLREWMADPAIKALLPQIHKLPAMPRLYSQVTEELNSPDCSLDTLAYLIRQDPVMSAKMLQLVNSAFFGLAREVSDLIDAVMILGTERIKSLILLAGVFSQYGDSGETKATIDSLMTHGIQVGVYARTIALSETKSAAMAEAAFTAGVLHDVGKVILAGNLPVKYREVRALRLSKRISDAEAEREVFGANHAALGACLLASWGLPPAILESVAWHHQPELSSDQGFTLLSAVCVGNAFAHDPTRVPTGLNEAYFSRIRMPQAPQKWFKLFAISR